MINDNAYLVLDSMDKLFEAAIDKSESSFSLALEA